MYTEKTFAGNTNSVLVSCGTDPKHFPSSESYRVALDKATVTDKLPAIVAVMSTQNNVWVANTNPNVRKLIEVMMTDMSSNQKIREQVKDVDFLYFKIKRKEKTDRTSQINDFAKRLADAPKLQLTEPVFKRDYLPFWILREDELDQLRGDSTESYHVLHSYAIHRFAAEVGRPSNEVEVIDPNTKQVLFVLPPLYPAPPVFDADDSGFQDRVLTINDAIELSKREPSLNNISTADDLLEDTLMINPEVHHAWQVETIRKINIARAYYGLGLLISDGKAKEKETTQVVLSDDEFVMEDYQ